MTVDDSSKIEDPKNPKALLPQRVDDGEKREVVEIGVAGADLVDAVFAHQDRGVKVVHKVAADFRELGQGRRQQIEVPIGRSQYRKTGL